MMKRSLTILIFLLAKLSTYSANYSENLYNNLERLNITSSVLYIAAHPDDENTRLISWLALEKKVRTGYLSLTRGDGGQNLIGKEQGKYLGIIRTNELLEARKIDGGIQFFTRAYDFGYSKTPEETLNFWNKDSILADVVLAIRLFKPDVIICRFPETGEGGHGHHTSSAILAKEAFTAAANPLMFPSQLAITQIWQPRYLFWNTFNFGNTNTTSEDQIKVDVGGYNYNLQKSYGEISAESRTMHKSQGFGSASSRGKSIEYFKQLAGEPVKELFGNIITSWERFGSINFPSALIDELKLYCIKNDIQSGFKNLKIIAEWLEIKKSDDELVKHYKKIKREELEKIVIQMAGVYSELISNSAFIIAGKNNSMQLNVISRNSSNVIFEKFKLQNKDTALQKSLPLNEWTKIAVEYTIDYLKEPHNPFWINSPIKSNIFQINNLNDRNLSDKKTSDPIELYLLIEGISVNYKLFPIFKKTDPTKGELITDVIIVPKVVINLENEIKVINNSSSATLKLKIRSFTENWRGKIISGHDEKIKVSFSQTEISLTEKDQELEITVKIEGIEKESVIKFMLQNEKEILSLSQKEISYDHVGNHYIHEKAEVLIVPLKINLTKKNLGYIVGSGDEVGYCLSQIGFNVTYIDENNYNVIDLNKFDAIVTGVRAYNTNQWMQGFYNKLMNYIESGGNLIVQYNTNNRIGPVVAKISPYDLNISRNRVTDENAQVKILNAEHPFFNTPNKITSSDFNNWIQERGIYFAEKVTSDYTPLLGMNDHGEEPLNGSLITAKKGKGNFVYTGLSFFRQLPAGVPGAYKMFVNLISLP